MIRGVSLPKLCALALGLACSISALVAIGPGADDRKVRVFAAASLATVLAGAPDCSCHFAGSARLTYQIEAGARAQILITADRTTLDRVLATRRATRPPRVFAKNRLAIIVPSTNNTPPTSLADLADERLRVVLAAPEVPAGRYALSILRRAGIEVAPVSEESSVTGVLLKVARGEADAGIVYESGARSAGERVATVSIPDADNVTAEYWLAALEESEVIDAVFDRLCGEEIAARLRAQGFRTR